MADHHLTTDPTEGHRLYCAWRFARAQWQLALYSPENLGDDLPDEVDSMHCDADHNALLAYFRHPAATWRELALKLRVFQEEDGTGLTQASEIIAAFAKDADKLMSNEAIREARQLKRAA